MWEAGHRHSYGNEQVDLTTCGSRPEPWEVGASPFFREEILVL